MNGGSRVKDDRRGGSPWLHKRGFGSAEAREGPRRGPKGILDAAGDCPPVFGFGFGFQDAMGWVRRPTIWPRLETNQRRLFRCRRGAGAQQARLRSSETPAAA